MDRGRCGLDLESNRFLREKKVSGGGFEIYIYSPSRHISLAVTVDSKEKRPFGPLEEN